MFWGVAESKLSRANLYMRTLLHVTLTPQETELYLVRRESGKELMVQMRHGERVTNHADLKRTPTSDPITVLELLALRDAISLENVRLYSDLRRSEAFLAVAQSLSQTGSFGWSVASGELYWSAETYSIFEHDRAVKPTLEMILRRTHPDDRDLVLQTLEIGRAHV